MTVIPGRRPCALLVGALLGLTLLAPGAVKAAQPASPNPVERASAGSSDATADDADRDPPTGRQNFFDYRGLRLGAYVSQDEHNGFHPYRSYLDFERKWEHKSDFIRVYSDWSRPHVLTPAQRKLAAGGRTLVISWNSYERDEGVRWSRVVSGRYDRKIDDAAAEVMSLPQQVLFTFQHEPDNHVDLPNERRAGTPTQFCAAYEYVVERFQAAGVRNATYGVIMMAWSGTTGRAEKYYCGGRNVEFLGVDGFNWYGCVEPDGPWRMPAEIFTKWYEWAVTKDKPMVIAEWGTGEDPAVPRRKAEWIRALTDLLQGWPDMKGAMIFNTARNRYCPRYSDTSRASQRAFVASAKVPGRP